MKAAMAEKKTPVVWKTKKVVQPPFVANDIIVHESGMKFRVLDSHGAMVPLDWENDKSKFALVASAHREESDDVVKTKAELDEEFYDISPEDREEIWPYPLTK